MPPGKFEVSFRDRFRTEEAYKAAQEVSQRTYGLLVKAKENLEEKLSPPIKKDLKLEKKDEKNLPELTIEPPGMGKSVSKSEAKSRERLTAEERLVAQKRYNRAVDRISRAGRAMLADIERLQRAPRSEDRRSAQRPGRTPPQDQTVTSVSFAEELDSLRQREEQGRAAAPAATPEPSLWYGSESGHEMGQSDGRRRSLSQDWHDAVRAPPPEGPGPS